MPQAEAFECETASLCESFETIVDSFVFSFVECRATRENGNDNISDTSVYAPMVMLATDGFRNSFFSPFLFEQKVKDIGESACLNKRAVRVANLKLLYEKLSKESVFQDDISTIIATRMKRI